MRSVVFFTLILVHIAWVHSALANCGQLGYGQVYSSYTNNILCNDQKPNCRYRCNYVSNGYEYLPENCHCL